MGVSTWGRWGVSGGLFVSFGVCLFGGLLNFKSWLPSEKTVNTSVWLYLRFTPCQREGKEEYTKHIAINVRKKTRLWPWQRKASNQQLHKILHLLSELTWLHRDHLFWADQINDCCIAWHCPSLYFWTAEYLFHTCKREVNVKQFHGGTGLL